MKIKTITVTAGRTFNHPHEEYSNLRPEITIVAEVSDDEDASAVAKQLQQQAEGLVEDHKSGLLKSIDDLYQMTQAKARLVGLSRQLNSVQKETDEIRKQWPELNQLQLTDATQECPPPKAEDIF